MKPAVILILFATTIVAGWTASRYLARNATPQHALVLPQPMSLPAFSLLDQDAATFSPQQLTGRWSLLFFGFTHCPDICPATLQLLSLARAQLAERDAPLPEIVLVSVDPERDTPAALRAYVAHFGDGITGVSGELDELRKLTSTLGIYFEKETSAPESTDYNVAHSAHVIVIDDNGDYVAVFSAPHSVESFVSDLPLLMSAR